MAVSRFFHKLHQDAYKEYRDLVKMNVKLNVQLIMESIYILNKSKLDEEKNLIKLSLVSKSVKLKKASPSTD